MLEGSYRWVLVEIWQERHLYEHQIKSKYNSLKIETIKKFKDILQGCSGCCWDPENYVFTCPSAIWADHVLVS